MGHRHDATEALRAYARDIESTIGDGAVERVGSTHQGDVAASRSGFGAPHHGLIAGAVGVALVGLVGAWFLLAPPSNQVTQADAPTAPNQRIQTAAVSPRVVQSPSTPTAIRAVATFRAAGLEDAATAVAYAMEIGIDTRPEVVEAIDGVYAALAAFDSGFTNAATDDVSAAVDVLLLVTHPPRLGPSRTSPGHGGTPPGQDDTFVPRGQDETVVPPGQDETFVPPGQDETRVPPGRSPSKEPGGQHGEPPKGGSE
jgi:hypothetical protein